MSGWASELVQTAGQQFLDEERKEWLEFVEALRREHIVQDDFHECPVCKLHHHRERVDWQPTMAGFKRPDGTFVGRFMIGDRRCAMKLQFFHWRYGFYPDELFKKTSRKRRREAES